jgi:2'-5' RNA ligase
VSESAKESALLVPVHDAEESVAGLRSMLDPAAAQGLPAHVTLLYPFGPVRSFAEEECEALAAAVASCPAFDFILSTMAWFDDRVLYLAPEDPTPFVALTTALVTLFPAFPPYRGEYDSIVPHMTVAEGARPWRMRRGARALAKVLPIECRADAVWWMTPGIEGRWVVNRRFALGRAQANRGLSSL